MAPTSYEGGTVGLAERSHGRPSMEEAVKAAWGCWKVEELTYKDTAECRKVTAGRR